MGREYLVPLGPERFTRRNDRIMQPDADVAARTAGNHVVAGDLVLFGYGIGFEHADGIAGPEYGRDVVRLVDVFHQDGEIRLAGREHAAEFAKAIRGHGGVIEAALLYLINDLK